MDIPLDADEGNTRALQPLQLLPFCHLAYQSTYLAVRVVTRKKLKRSDHAQLRLPRSQEREWTWMSTTVLMDLDEYDRLVGINSVGISSEEDRFGNGELTDTENS